MEKSAVHLGQDEQNSYEFRALFYNSTFDSNPSYEKGKEGGNLAAQNPINEDGFYAYTDKDGTKALAVDFYGDLIPGRTYWIVLVPDPASNEVGGNVRIGSYWFLILQVMRSVGFIWLIRRFLLVSIMNLAPLRRIST